MTILINCQGLTAIHGGRPLFSGLDLTLGEGDRAGMIGPNGAGKSTLLRIMAGELRPDGGQCAVSRTARIAYVTQEPRFDETLTVEQVIEAALPTRDEDAQGAVRQALGQVGFVEYGEVVGRLSGGWKKRLAIARALVTAPDLMLLDEPTNHLDVEGVLWLERFLSTGGVPFLVVSHDRVFLENVATRVIELNPVYPSGCFESTGNYTDFLLTRDEFIRAQARYQDSLENKVRREIEWLRRGAKARSTKAKARIDSAGRMIEELDDLKDRTSQRTARVDFEGSGRKTRNLLVAERVSKSIEGRPLFKGIDVALGPGDRLGIIGRNGSGKTTLLRILTGNALPDSGKVEHADNLKMVYFDQHRASLDRSRTLRQALIAGDGDHVRYRDQNMHVAAWARRFAFRLEQLDLPVSELSGGEQARVAIARLIQEPADLLVLDEPTNDLDISTLEVLEDSLSDFPGAVILVTHDRYMLGRLSSQLLALDGRGGAERVADLAQWEALEARRLEAERKAAKPRATPPVAPTPKPKPAGLSFKERRELEGMEAAIQAAESEVTRLEAHIQSPGLATRIDEFKEACEQLKQAQERVESLYARWAALEERAGA